MTKSMLFLSLSLLTHNAFAVDLDAAADDVCGCLEEPYKLVEQSLQELSKAQASGDFSRLMEVQGNMMGIIDSSTLCFEDLPRKYPEIDKDKTLQDKVMAKVDEQCPNPAEKYRP